MQPVVTYEGSVFSSADYGGESGEEPAPDTRRIVGFEAIDTHVEHLLEAWETHSDFNAGIDALTILAGYPERYAAPSSTLYEALRHDITAAVTRAERPADILIHAMQLPELYDMLTQEVMTEITSETPLDTALRNPLVEGYLDAYAQMNLTQGGKFEALRQLYLACKSDTSTL